MVEVKLREDWISKGYTPEMLIWVDPSRFRVWGWDTWDKAWLPFLNMEAEWSHGKVFMAVLDTARQGMDKIDTQTGGIIVIYSKDRCCFWIENIWEIALRGVRS